MKYVFDIIKELENESSRNGKIEILKKNKDNAVLKAVIEYALDPFKVYGIKKIPEYRPLKVSARPLISVLKDLSVLMDRKKTGNAAIDWLVLQFESLDSEEADLLNRVISKDLRCGVSISTVNKVWPGFIHDYPIMKCESFSEKAMNNIRWPAFVQEKLDGMRVNFTIRKGKVAISSSSGKPLDLLGMFDDSMLKLSKNVRGGDGVVFDGELLVLDKNGKYLPRKKGNGIINKAMKGTLSVDEAKRIVAVLWDIVYLDDFKKGISKVTYAQRFEFLENLVEQTNHPNIRLVETSFVDSFYEAKQIYMNIISRGGEGVIIKNAMSIWEGKRSKEHVKMKVENDCDLIILEVVEGEGKYRGKVGSFFCESADGSLQVNVGSGFSDEQRDVYFTSDLVGKIVTVKYNEVIEKENTATKSLFLPIFVELREDKNEADTLQKILLEAKNKVKK